MNKSEQIFEDFLTANNLQFEKIKEGALPTPDYLISITGKLLIVEVKELMKDENFGIVDNPNHRRAFNRGAAL